MSDDNLLNPIEIEGQDLPAYRDPSLDTIEEIMTSLLDSANVEAVYGTPIKQKDTLIIPAAEIVAVSGFGLGQGFGGPEGEKESAGGAGGGGGGGGSAYARPVAVVVLSPDGVRIEPVYDWTKIALAGVTLAAFAVGMFARLESMQRRFSKMRKAIE